MAAFCKISFVCLILFVFGQYANGLVCYSCISCNDPFSSSGISTVTNSTSGSYCQKTSTLSVVTRSLVSSCTAVNILGNGNWCCQTDYCNSAPKLLSTSSLFLALIITAAVKLF